MPSPLHLSLPERLALGKQCRQAVARSSHAQFKLPGERDPIALLEASSKDRVETLIPVRYGRMLQSPFTFFRGTALIQAHDLANTASTGLIVQACGDAHLMNFGVFATPERNLVFDINDFDETLPAPWEWDLKRLSVSVVLAARELGFKESEASDAAAACCASYRQRMGEYAQMSELALWYDKLSFERLYAAYPDAEQQRQLQQWEARARSRTQEELLPKLTTEENGALRIRDTPPFLFHIRDGSSMRPEHDHWRSKDEWTPLFHQMFKGYLDTLQDDRRHLLARYRPVDMAFKVVGVGSVGTRCLVLLMQDDNDQPLFLQLKEARASVLASCTPKQPMTHQGLRVVTGQRLMQSASDIFLGWTKGPDNRHVYVRQLHDMKASAMLESFDQLSMQAYATSCAWTLARAHARTGGLAGHITGYLGKGPAFDEAIAAYSIRYADQVEKDYHLFRAATRNGRLPVDAKDDDSRNDKTL